MTVIAVRGKTIAADALETTGELISGLVVKLYRAHNGAVAGAAGNAYACQRFGVWFAGARGKSPNISSDSFEALMLDIDGKIYLLDEHGTLLLRTGEYAALGSGAHLALGAMAAGATAEQAVAIAIKLNVMCGGEVQVERLKPRGRTPAKPRARHIASRKPQIKKTRAT